MISEGSCDNEVGDDRYVFFRADAKTSNYRSSIPITDILNQYGVKIND